MKTTIDIPDELMKDALKFSKASTKREAVVSALEDYIRRQKVKKVLKMFGTFENMMTQEELMDMRWGRGKYASPR